LTAYENCSRLVNNNEMGSPKSVTATGIILLCNTRHMLLTNDNRGVKIREATTTPHVNYRNAHGYLYHKPCVH